MLVKRSPPDEDQPAFLTTLEKCFRMKAPFSSEQGEAELEARVYQLA